MNDSILKSLETWIPISISFLSLIITSFFSIKANKIMKKAEEKNQENERMTKEFELYKEEKRQRDAIITSLLMEQSTRVSVVPYFNIVLRDERIIESNDKITLGIGVINIGKESATNVQLVPKISERGLNEYFDSDKGYKYGISEYLNRYYARPGEEIIFYIGIFKKESISDFLNFKIKYYDLIGNCYIQEFRFGFDNYLLNGYYLDNTSYVPKLVKNDK